MLARSHVASNDLSACSRSVLLVAITLGCWGHGPYVFADEIRISCRATTGTIRPLHGVNGGPLNYGETIDLSASWRELGIPVTRLHDCEWPAPAVVDMHAVFPVPDADPALPGSYQFARTDDYLKSIADTGCGFVYRLGESIEHSRRKHFVNPPVDFEKWTAACIGIIRHVNEGWANGTHLNVRYWEIWNEPENRPNMWTGTDEDYYRLYSTAAKGIKAKFPALMIGGPAVGNTGEVVDGKFQPTAFLTGFIKHCRETSSPLDFFSWHTYTNDPRLYGVKARAIRKWLDDAGFHKTEIHLNEWNYLPNDDWGVLSVTGQGAVRENWYAEMGGPNGAAFIASVLTDLQDSPITVANLFTGDTGPFGLFSRHGAPKKTYYAVKAFRALLDTPQRLAFTTDLTSAPAVLAGVNGDRTEVSILLSNYRTPHSEFDLVVEDLPWQGRTKLDVRAVDAQHDLGEFQSLETSAAVIRLPSKFSGSGIRLIQLRKASVP